MLEALLLATIFVDLLRNVLYLFNLELDFVEFISCLSCFLFLLRCQLRGNYARESFVAKYTRISVLVCFP